MFLSYLQSQQHCFVLLPHSRIVICAWQCAWVLLVSPDARNSPLPITSLEQNQELRPLGTLSPEAARLQHNPQEEFMTQTCGCGCR